MSIRTNGKRFAAHLPPSGNPILTSDERHIPHSGVSMGELIRLAEREADSRRQRRVEVRATVELCLRVNLSMVVYGE